MLAVASVLMLAQAPAQPHAKQRAQEPPAAVREFSVRVNHYLEERKLQAGTSPRPTKSAQKLIETREHMRARLQAARVRAKQGDIFTPTISAYLRKQIAEAFRGPAGARILASLRRAEPVDLHLAVNQPYPEGIPLQSMPPTLLMKLPKLPKELEYRIVGRNLILLDAAPNLVVDILPDALPRKP